LDEVRLKASLPPIRRAADAPPTNRTDGRLIASMKTAA
jgi:hypothetical protein